MKKIAVLSLAQARILDRRDSLRKFRTAFHFPRHGRTSALYFCGNSLGLLPKQAAMLLKEETDQWKKFGVEGHFRGKRPWMTYHRQFTASLAQITGALPSEVVAMNQLTVNLHLMLTSFYRPTSQRYRIIAEAGAFSSDRYAIESQIRLHGLSLSDTLVEISPLTGEHALRTEDILSTIRQHGATVALVLFSGVQYYSGQYFDIASITKAAHDVGAFAGFDLAHAIGNVPLELHDHGVDFAVWCSYKYLNGGPGAIAGAFIHEQHHQKNLPRLAGWWGHEEKNRFAMRPGFTPMAGAEGWQLSNFPVMSGTALLASLAIFRKAGMKAIRQKSIRLTGYCEAILTSLDPQQQHFLIITPSDRGAQLSLLMKHDGRAIFDWLTHKGVIADWREPDVIRIAPAPLYNSFEDVVRFGDLMQGALKAVAKRKKRHA
ncbi:MAG: kynureninase [Cyclobacteriaceae bacterium]